MKRRNSSPPMPLYQSTRIDTVDNSSNNAPEDQQQQDVMQRMEIGVSIQSIDDYNIKKYDHESFTLPESTHSLLFTEPIRSMPFVFSIGIAAMSYASLSLALCNNIAIGTVPANVDISVKLAQYLCEYILTSIMRIIK